MIKVNELRIGNLVKEYDGAISQIADYTALAPHFIERYESIPLTPEILEECGFVDHANNGKAYRKDVTYCKAPFENIKDELCWYKQGKDLRLQSISGGFTRMLEIKYLHQLQNLYFALTGEELEVKFE